MKYTTIYFDLDDTLYPSNTGLWEAIRERMSSYMTVVLGIPDEEARDLRKHYYATYGTTLRGLQKHHCVDVDEYLSYVHNLPLSEYIQPDDETARMITLLPQRKFIFTNADADHARRVLKILGLNGCFENIIDIRAIDFACKPELSAYQRALEIADNPEPQSCLMLDDSLANLRPAKELGFTTILVGGNSETDSDGHLTIANIKDLLLVLPELWAGSGR
jgi:putative hydrolase of the HAD superfamily